MLATLLTGNTAFALNKRACLGGGDLDAVERQLSTQRGLAQAAGQDGAAKDQAAASTSHTHTASQPHGAGWTIRTSFQPHRAHSAAGCRSSGGGGGGRDGSDAGSDRCPRQQGWRQQG